MEGVRLGPALSLFLPLLGTPIVGEQLEGRAPFLELHLPIQHHACGHDDEVRTPHPPAHRQGDDTSKGEVASIAEKFPFVESQ